jgi:NitT/TauT family transport system substrate-binding protein
MRRRLAAILFTGALLATTAACGDDNGGGDDADLDVINVGVIPIVDVAPLFLGIEQGFFEDVNIQVETEFAAGGADIVPGVAGGQFDFGFGNILSVMIAGSNPDLDIRVVSNGNNSTGVQGNDFGSIMVATDSPYQSASDLEGATVAINTLNAIAQLVVQASVEADGGDPSTIEFVALPFPEMPAALDNGDVDAAFPVEPFQTIIESNGFGRSIASAWVDAAPDLTVAVYFTSGTLMDDNPDLVQRFITAMERSLAYANDNPDAARAILPTYTALDADLASVIVLPAWPPAINRASAETLARRAVEAGMLEQMPDLDALLP